MPVTLHVTCAGCLFNPFIPEFLKWTLTSLNLDTFTDVNRGLSLKSKTEWQTVKILMRRLVSNGKCFLILNINSVKFCDVWSGFTLFD